MQSLWTQQRDALAHVWILTPKQMRNNRFVNLTSVQHLLKNIHGDAIHNINRLLKSSQSHEVNGTYSQCLKIQAMNWKHTSIETRMVEKMCELEALEKLNSQDDTESRTEFSINLDWKGSIVEPDRKQAAKALLIDFHDICARHRFDLVYKTKFKFRTTHLDDEPTHSQSVPESINLKMTS